jgi:hypothetical protein
VLALLRHRDPHRLHRLRLTGRHRVGVPQGPVLPDCQPRSRDGNRPQQRH